MKPTVQTQVRLPPDLYDWAKAEAVRRGVSLNTLIIKALGLAREKEANDG